MRNGFGISMNKSEETISISNNNGENLLVLLEEEQRKSGYLSQEFITALAQSLDTPVSEIYGVISFYSFLTNKLQGRNIIRICKNLPCFLKNSELIIKCITQELGIKPGQTTPDGRFTLVLTNCIGACDKAPAMMINNDIYGDLTPQKITKILESYK